MGLLGVSSFLPLLFFFLVFGSEISQRKQGRKRETERRGNIFFHPLYISSLPPLSPSLSFLLALVAVSPAFSPSASSAPQKASNFPKISGVCFLMKKLKGVAAVQASPYPVAFEDPRTRVKFQSLLQDYQDLQQVISYFVPIGFCSGLLSSIIGSLCSAKVRIFLCPIHGSGDVDLAISSHTQLVLLHPRCCAHSFISYLGNMGLGLFPEVLLYIVDLLRFFGTFRACWIWLLYWCYCD